MDDIKTIYLDNNATTMVAPEVLEAMLPYLKGSYGNPSSMHRFGGKIRKSIDYARGQIASFLGADESEIYFTSCGTESNNTAINGFCEQHGQSTRLITSAVEHPAVLNPCENFQKKGIPLSILNVDEYGIIDVNQINSDNVQSDTLVSVMWANNETGVISPIEELSKKVKEFGGYFHTDAVQAVGKIPINLKNSHIDMLSFSGHKLHAPKGVGALYVRKGVKISPFLIGGHQENGFRGGTENVAFIVGLGVACELAQKRITEDNKRLAKMRDRLESELLKSCKGAKLNGHKEKRLSNTLNISFENIEGEAVLLFLDEKGIAASSGSACTSGSLEPSHVMRAMGIPYTYAHSSTRFSLSSYNTEDDIDAVIDAMPGIVEHLRSLSPFV